MSHSYEDNCPKCGEDRTLRNTHTCPIPREAAIDLLVKRAEEFVEDRDGVFLSEAERNLNIALNIFRRSDDYAASTPLIKSKTYTGPDRRSKPRVRPKR